MTKPKTKIMGRPRIEIDFEQFEKLCNYQATIGEIASWFDMSVDTLEERIREKFGCTFSAYTQRHKDMGKISVRRKQFSEAMKGNTTMLIHLGKNYLEQFDRNKIESDNTNKNVEVSYEDYIKTLGDN